MVDVGVPCRRACPCFLVALGHHGGPDAPFGSGGPGRPARLALPPSQTRLRTASSPRDEGQRSQQMVVTQSKSGLPPRGCRQSSSRPASLAHQSWHPPRPFWDASRNPGAAPGRREANTLLTACLCSWTTAKALSSDRDAAWRRCSTETGLVGDPASTRCSRPGEACGRLQAAPTRQPRA